MSARSSNVLDSFAFRNGGIFLKPFHAQRTFEALALLQLQTKYETILDIYGRLEDQLKNSVSESELVRVVFSSPNDYSYEIIPISLLPIPVRLQVLQSNKNPDGIGKHNYKWSDRSNWNELLKLKSPNVDDIIAVNGKHDVTETTRCNLFFYSVGEDIVFTPPLTSGCINGVYRRFAISQKWIDLPVYGIKSLVEKNISITELQALPCIYEIFVANSVRGVLEAELIAL